MNNDTLSELLDLSAVQKMANANFAANGMPIGIIDAIDNSILVGSGWQEICTKFHRTCEKSLYRCQASDNYIKDHLVEGQPCGYKCQNGLWDIGIPIVVAGQHLATMFLGQFFYEDEKPNRDFFIQQAAEFGYDLDRYLAALDKVPVFTHEKVNYIIEHNKSLIKFLTALAENSIKQKTADLALKQSEERYRRLTENARDVIYRMSLPDGRYEYANPATLDLLGYTPAELYESPLLIKRLIHPDWADYFQEQWDNLLKGIVPASYEYQIIHKSGDTKWLHQRNVLVKDADNNPIALEGIATDISKRKYAEEQREKLEAQLIQSQKMEAIGRLVGGIAHDLNNLLSPILGYSQLLLSDSDLTAAQKEELELIHMASKGARDLVRQLLAFGRKQTLSYNLVNINEPLARFYKLLRHTIRENIDINIHTSPNIQPILADVVQLEQIIMNLAVNAADAMPEGGILTIETSIQELDDTYTASYEDVRPGMYVLLAISDTGIGMDKETRMNIFDPFFSTKEKLGTGLGLSTVYGIVKQHKGHIAVYSEPNVGSTFKIYFPISDDSSIASEPEKKRPTTLVGTETILLVEDNKEVSNLAKKILIKHGYTVLQAPNSSHAINMLKSHTSPIDLLVTDVIMPGMNGKELFNTLKSVNPQLKVLYMSGYTNNVIAHHGVLDPGIHFVQKPFSVHSLLTKVRETLDE